MSGRELIARYLLDANVLMRASNEYYEIERVPEYWKWLLEQGRLGRIKVPRAIWEEVKPGRGDTPKDTEKRNSLFAWVKRPEFRDLLLLEEDPRPECLHLVIERGYGLPNPSDTQLKKIGADTTLISYAYENLGRAIVTDEVSKPKRKGANRHIPDVCKDLGIRCINQFELNRERDFRTSPKSPA